MSKDIPEIDDLTRGINDSELILAEDSVETKVEQKEKNKEAQEKDYYTCVLFFSYYCQN
jgi:hypothetical protein